MPTVEKRLSALEKSHLREKNTFTYQIVCMEENDSPEEHERKLRQIEEIEASGGGVFVVSVVGEME